MNISPSSTEKAAQLTDIADSLLVALYDLRYVPTPETCELVAIQLEGARRHCLDLASTLRLDRDLPRWHDAAWLVEQLSRHQERAGGGDGR